MDNENEFEGKNRLESVASTIESIELFPVFIPFTPIAQQTMESGEGGLGMAIKTEEAWTGGDFVICRLVTSDGYVGLGESFVWLPETGVSPAQITSIIQRSLHTYILGANPFDIKIVNQRMDANVARNEVAKGLLDMACYDLMGRIKDVPACNFMGNPSIDAIPLAALVPLVDVETMVALAEMFVKTGYRTIRVKLGRGIFEDAAIMGQLRDYVGPDIRFRVDYNQAYTPNDAIEAISAIEQFNVDVVEQPVAAEDYIGMAMVQKHVNVPLMAHEGFFSLRDFLVLAELGAVQVLGLNSERPGGVTKALEVLDIAKQRSMGAVIHNQTLGIASAMQLHLAAARYNDLGHDPELTGQYMFEEDLITTPIEYKKGTAKLPRGPGFGVDLDTSALEKYTIDAPVEIKLH
ncbi:MAG TPA: mandelate racemase/muconate lactonizing enzyme family protein [Candidatus Lokiarchaeia archaeon]|nr:mandelate racemase/muconate lactonizing enzyme family protein [Candidatus Lokiarchaeia archaeon]